MKLSSLKFIKYILLLIAVILVLPRYLLVSFNTGLDPSWGIALQNAWDHNLIFGKDFVFTYGPFGFLAARIPAESTYYWIFLFDLFIRIQLLAILFRVIKQNFGWPVVCLILWVLILLGGGYNYMESATLLLFYTLFWLFLDLKELQLNNHQLSRFGIFFLLSSTNSLICFLLKLNMGLVALFIQVLYCGYLIVLKHSFLAASGNISISPIT